MKGVGLWLAFGLSLAFVAVATVGQAGCTVERVQCRVQTEWHPKFGDTHKAICDDPTEKSRP